MDARIIDGALGTRTGRGLRLVLATSLAVALGLAALPGAAVTAEDAAFPLTVVDDEGTEVTLDAPPERIISLSPANTEIVFALGAGDRLVGGTAFDDFPAEAVDLPDVATYQGVVTEQVVDLEPDLVLAAGNFFTPPDDVARLRELGYPVIVVYAPDVPAVLADIELIGTAIGAADEAAAMTAQMSEQLDAVGRGRGGHGQHAAHLLPDRLRAGDLRPGPGVLRGRHGGPGRRRAHHHQRPGRLLHPARGARRGRPRGHRRG